MRPNALAVKHEGKLQPMWKCGKKREKKSKQEINKEIECVNTEGETVAAEKSEGGEKLKENKELRERKKEGKVPS